jgi:hypothetical protein
MKPRADYRKGLAHVGQMPALAKTTADIAKDCLKRPKTTQAAKLIQRPGRLIGESLFSFP